VENLKSIWLNELTWEDVEEYLKEDDIAIFPVGSLEQHGPAGPLGVDSYAAIALAEDTAKRTNVLSTPPLWFGDSVHHLAFPGTVSLSTETLINVVKDVIRSLARHGFKKVLIINGHKGANLAALETACKNIREFELPEVILAIADPMHIAKGIAGEIKDFKEHHAGELEISHVMHKFPGLVKEDKLTEEVVDLASIFSPLVAEDLLGPSGDTINMPWNSYEQKKFAPSGSFSPSMKASTKKGKKYHDYMVDRLVDFINHLKNYQGPIGNTAKK